ncbi:hypothetical protein WMY93_017239 [Mugilogobius chulae]|uniref:Protein TBATA n=1 Tax=Mugilogobius chulae TaxID=88201 RepID=A0AAW0NXW4_9GOBI
MEREGERQREKEKHESERDKEREKGRDREAEDKAVDLAQSKCPMSSSAPWGSVILGEASGRHLALCRPGVIVQIRRERPASTQHRRFIGNVFRRGPDLPLAHCLSGASGNKSKSSLLSERWRDELKELAARIQCQEEAVRRHTQYSSQTGRIIPPSSKSYQRRSYSRSQTKTQPQVQLQDQELMVLELLCQILQTDSISTVQHWLLLAGQREKDHVESLLKHALDGMDLQNQDFRLYPHVPLQCNPGVDPTWPLSPQRNRFKHFHDPSCSRFRKLERPEVLQLVDADESKDETTAE